MFKPTFQFHLSMSAQHHHHQCPLCVWEKMLSCSARSNNDFYSSSHQISTTRAALLGSESFLLIKSHCVRLIRSHHAFIITFISHTFQRFLSTRDCLSSTLFLCGGFVLLCFSSSTSPSDGGLPFFLPCAEAQCLAHSKDCSELW